ncbi:MAG TPA: hypothetical protein DHW71_00135 [Gammaproteobacteria bacterium]|nr:hypothetical protein [Gammaproteobacteria bacterium]MEC8010258.1 hypothetical protein [Pseudomonadota bacterium]HCK91356.1 hypothetical protein [Gammaproteobacteria bacterium]
MIQNSKHTNRILSILTENNDSLTAFKINFRNNTYQIEARIIPSNKPFISLKLPHDNSLDGDLLTPVEYRIPQSKLNANKSTQIILLKEIQEDSITIRKISSFAPIQKTKLSLKDLQPVGESKTFGSSWRIFEESTEPHVQKQLYKESCGQACISILLNNTVSQDTICKHLGKTNALYCKELAETLNHFDPAGQNKWTATSKVCEAICRLDIHNMAMHFNTLKKPWVSSMHNCIGGGHFVIVDRYSPEHESFTIRCPGRGLSFKMPLDEFALLWTGRAVIYS